MQKTLYFYDLGGGETVSSDRWKLKRGIGGEVATAFWCYGQIGLRGPDKGQLSAIAFMLKLSKAGTLFKSPGRPGQIKLQGCGMNQWTVIIGIIFMGLLVLTERHLRMLRLLRGPLERLALEEGGRVEGRFPRLPQLVLDRDGLTLRLSVATSGLRGRDRLYTYVLFEGVRQAGVRWRLQPRLRSRLEMDFGDFTAGHQTQVTTGSPEFDRQFILTGSDSQNVAALFDPVIQEQFLLWQHQQPGHGLFDLHPYDDKLVCSVRGVVSDHAHLHALLDLAEAFCRHYRRHNQIEAELGEKN